MMQRCGSYQCYSAGECSCGAFYGQSSYFSMPAYNNYYESETYSLDSSSPVDCTLSLGTPSTRMTEYDEKRREEQQSASNFGWDLPRTKHGPSKSSRRGGNSGADKTSASGDQMFARHCANCDTTTTPLWRNGPSGPKSLCNACGIRYKKEERKAASSGQQASSMYRNDGSSWLPHHSQGQKTPRFPHGIANDLNPGVAFLSWSLNDTEQPQLYYDFTS